MLDGLAKEGLTPRMVEEILGISAAELRRWTKDGRLPRSSADHFGEGNIPIRRST